MIMKAYISQKKVTQVREVRETSVVRRDRAPTLPLDPNPEAELSGEDLQPLSRSMDAPGLEIETDGYNPYETQVLELAEPGAEDDDSSDPYNNTGCYKVGDIWRRVSK